MDLEQELERDEDYDRTVLYHLIQNYGDLLKVSRSRGQNKILRFRWIRKKQPQ